MTTAPHASVKELRLAAVLCGGSSLGVYMHGVTKELHRLVQASRALEHDLPLPAGEPSSAVYRNVLARLTAAEGVATRVVVDVVAGTSAGGLNGIFLAAALARDRSLEPLTRLWLEEADLGRLLRSRALRFLYRALVTLLRPWRAPRQAGVAGLVVRAPGRALAALGLAILALAATLAAAAVGAVRLLARRPALAPLLDGDRLLRLGYGALESTRGGSSASLLPDGHRLDLFVTATDLEGYDRRVRLWRPATASDRCHRHVLAFAHERRADGVPDELLGRGPAETSPVFASAALALAGRATSSLPGAFAPVSLASLRTLLGPAWTAADAAGLERTLFAAYAASGASASRSLFVDGGILDNKPLGLAVEAIARRPAAAEVDRKLLYLEPDPAGRAAAAGEGREPSLRHTLRQAFFSIPRSEPILDDLLAIESLNESVGRVREAIEAARPAVAEAVDAALAKRSGADPPVDLHAEAQRLLGPAYAVYATLKLRSVLDQLGGMVARLLGSPPESSQSAFVRETVHAWGEARGLARPAGPAGALTAAQIAFLRGFDLDYGRRRLRFVIGGLNELYPGGPGQPQRRDLDLAKEALYRLRARLDAAASEAGPFASSLARELAALFAPVREAGRERHAARDAEGGPAGAQTLHPAAFARERASRLDRVIAGIGELLEDSFAPGDLSQTIRTTVEALTTGWGDEARHLVLVRFLGFPVWDALLYPLRAFAALHELDPVEVVRLSPRDRVVLAGAAGGGLAGARRGHLGAFWTRAGRERDYLWGRLDGAEQLLAVLLGNPQPGSEAFRELTASVHAASAAILREERDRLREARQLAESLERTLAASQAGAAT